MENLKSFTISIDDATFNFTFDSNYLYNYSVDIVEGIHVHADYELFINFDGLINIQTKDCSHPFGPNKLIIVPPFKYHYTVSGSEENLCYRLLVSFEAKKGRISRLHEILNDIFIPDKITAYPIDGENFETYCADLRTVFESSLSSGNSRVISLLTLIILKISDISHKPLKHGPDEMHRSNYPDEICKIISRHFMDDIKIKDVAKRVNICERHASRILKKHYNKTFSQLVTEKRLAVAAMMLIKTDYSVKQIIDKVNIETESYFYILFKRAYGITPLQYRKQYLNDLKKI